MVEFDIKINPQQRIAYIPKELYEVLTAHSKAIANRTAVLFFPVGTSTEDIITSIDIIRADLMHAKEMQKKQEASESG
jgi:hypothetical protein